MLKTLRSRLLASYLAIIVVILLALVAGIFFQTATQNQRAFRIGGELSLVSRGMVEYVQQTMGTNHSDSEVESRLDKLARQIDVRLLVVDAEDFQIKHDSMREWKGEKIPQELVERSLDDVIRRPEQSGTYWWLHTPITMVTDSEFIILAKEDPAAINYFSEEFAKPLLRSALAAGGLAIVLGAWIARSVANPLRRMARAANAVAEGDYDQQLELEGPEEVKIVAQNFNHMAAQVKATQQSQRDFLANVSHDLRTPITSIQGWSQALVDGVISDNKMRVHSAEIIHNEAGRMHRMVNQLLDLTRLEEGQFTLNKKPVDLAVVLTDICDNLALKAQAKEVALRLTAHSSPIVSVDPDRLIQIVTNLVSNALAHTQAGDSIELALSAESKNAVIKVSDTGVGISEEDIGRIFERFYQADKSRKRTSEKEGTGLGLAITRELVQAHGGTIAVRSQLGEGTTFAVTLPSRLASSHIKLARFT